ncbi:hypothetical protein D2E76_16365 [Mycobacteroides abscessus]|uniref:Uncharacterized protein n=1 Tax=Mycobacteroides abscessus TaxID=36809 RepID=A0ABD7HM24_9MYCO|nr:hypothetical protein [Mycobacteroides abscessus]RIT36826.1 hypothetical protein D2E76_16365 [Mycobacteroides abscessus]
MSDKVDYRALYGPRPQNPPADGGGQHRQPAHAAAPAPESQRPAGPAPAHHRTLSPAAQYATGANPWEPAPTTGLELDGSKTRRAGARTGLRGRINRILGTRLPPNEAETTYEAECASIKAPIPTIKHVGFLHAKGGTGGTTSLQMVGNTLAEQRRGTVYAIDADYGGSLLLRTRDVSGTNSPKSTRTLHRWDPRGGEHFGSMFWRTPQGLMAIGNPKVTNDPPIEPHEFIDVLNKFPREGEIRLIDMPREDTPLFVPLLQGLSSIVLVTTPEQDSVRLCEKLRDTIREHGRPDLVANMVVVVNHRSPADPVIDEAKLAAVFDQGDELGAAAGLQRVLYAGYDAHLAEGGAVDYNLVDADTLKRYVTITAAIVARLTA